jgi:hypothetical protein
MQIVNEQTGVTYTTRTHSERGVYVSIVTRRQNNTETVSSRENHKTRADAYRYAVTMAKALARLNNVRG